jgi:hypothetical protein
MIRAREANVPAELRHPGRDAKIVGRDDDARHRRGRGGAAVDMFDHRTTVDVGEGLARKPRGGESSGDESDDLQGKAAIGLGVGRSRVHDE